MNPYLTLAISIAAEIAATLSLKAAEGLTRPGPTALVVLGYGTALWLMSSAVAELPIGFVYALWSSVGMIGAAIGGAIFFGEQFNGLMISGMTVIGLGITILSIGQSQA